MPRIIRLAFVFMFVVVPVAACAGDGDDGSVPQSGGSPAASSTTAGGSAAPASTVQASEPVDPREGGFEVGFGEFAITLEARAIRPGDVTFVIRNGGQLVHGFEMKIEESGSNSGSGGGDDDSFKIESDSFGPGEVLNLDMTLAPGVYEVECFIEEHDDMGMRAFLEVREDAPLAAPEVAAAPGAVQIEAFAFAPATVEVPAGTEVVWTNADPTAHTVTADDGSFGSDPLDTGGTFSFVAAQPGSLAYFCAIHPTMTGTVQVVA